MCWGSGRIVSALLSAAQGGASIIGASESHCSHDGPAGQGRQHKADATGALAVLQAWISSALELGATTEDPPRQEPFGAEAWLLDPEGNRLLLLVNPSP